jgi:hypothetical protein
MNRTVSHFDVLSFRLTRWIVELSENHPCFPAACVCAVALYGITGTSWCLLMEAGTLPIKSEPTAAVTIKAILSAQINAAYDSKTTGLAPLQTAPAPSLALPASVVSVFTPTGF